MKKISQAKRRVGVFGLVFFSWLFVIIFSCADDSSLIDKGDQFIIESISLEDGDWLLKKTENLNTSQASRKTAYIFFRIKGSAEKSTNSLLLRIDLYNRDGNLVASFEKRSPSINSDIPIEIPEEIQPEYYRLQLTLYKGNKLLANVSRNFFLLEEEIFLNGIYSFPAFIYPEKPVLLIADLKAENKTNPYLRWVYKKGVISEGLLSDGYNQIFWEAPIKEGVYTLELEIYPFPPLTQSLETFKKIYKGETEIFIVPNLKKEPHNSNLNFSSDLFQIYFDTLKTKDRMLKQNKILKTVQALPRIIGDSLTLKLNGETTFFCSQKLIFANKKMPSLKFDIDFVIENYVELINKKIIKFVFTEELIELNLFFNDKGELSLFLIVDKDEYLFSSGLRGFDRGANYSVSIKISEAKNMIDVEWQVEGEQIERNKNYADFTNVQDKFNRAQGLINGLSLVLKKLNLFILK